MTSPQHSDKPNDTATDPAHITFQGKQYTRIREGLADILNPRSTTQQQGSQGQGSRTKQSVFYNPIQQFNRDLSVLAIRVFAEDSAVLRRKFYERRVKGLARGKKRKRWDGGDGGSGGQNGKKAALSGAAVEEKEIGGEQGAEGGLDVELDNSGIEATHPSIEGASDKVTDHPSVEAPHSGNASADVKHTADAMVQKAQNTIEPAVVHHTADTTGQNKEVEYDKEPLLKPPEPDHHPQRDTPPNISPPFRILDALSATGLRALRYAKEISHVTSVTANDLLPSATASINVNVEYNALLDKVHPSTGDAKALMYEAATNHARTYPFHAVDLDPYGTAAPFLDAAVQAVTDCGLLCVTCTDAGIFASVSWLEKTYSQYGGLPWKGPQSHEAGLRLILNAVATSAARYGLAIEPLLSLHVDFYVRLFIRIKRSPVEVKCLASKTMVVYNCDYGCGAFSVQYFANTREREAKNGDKFHTHALAQGPTATPRCEHCGFKTHLAGPMWGGPLHNPHFISKILNLLPSLDTKVYATIPRIE
ncbi:MAG: hypothetical protein Q9210_002138, partial [Variospora velana]